jgi:IS5 family transposase
MMLDKRNALDKTRIRISKVPTGQIEKLKASIRAKVEHPFPVINCQLRHRKTRLRGFAINTNNGL